MVGVTMEFCTYLDWPVLIGVLPMQSLLATKTVYLIECYHHWVIGVRHRPTGEVIMGV